MKKLSNKLLLSAIAVYFISSMIGVSHARDYYYFDELQGILQANPATPFDGSENPEQQGSVSIAVESISMKASDTNKTFAITLTPSGDINADDVAVSFSLANEDVVLASDVSITGTGANRTLTIAKVKASGTVNITFSAVVNKVQEGTKIASIDVSESSNDAFITKWAVNAGNTVTMPTSYLHNYNGRICWDGENECSNFTSYNDAAFTHTYASGGTYTVSVTGTFEALSEWDKGSLKMISVENLGSVGWKTFKRAFYNAYKLKTFTAGDCDTSNVTSMQQMFKGVWYITDLDMKGFNTSKVTSMQEAFAYLVLLTELDVSNFDTSNVTNMHGMFRRVEKVTNLDVSNFNTSKVTNLSGMFDSMNSLTSLDVSNFNISNLISLHDVFDGLESIVNLDLSSFNTSGIEDMSWMFAGSKNLKTLNLSGFDMSNVNNVEYMFFIVSSLTDIIYSKTMSPAEYGNFLSKINIFGANLKDNGTLHIGSNTCGSDATCLSAKATLEGKGWEFSSN